MTADNTPWREQCDKASPFLVRGAILPEKTGAVFCATVLRALEVSCVRLASASVHRSRFVLKQHYVHPSRLVLDEVVTPPVLLRAGLFSFVCLWQSVLNHPNHGHSAALCPTHPQVHSTINHKQQTATATTKNRKPTNNPLHHDSDQPNHKCTSLFTQIHQLHANTRHTRQTLRADLTLTHSNTHSRHHLKTSGS